MKPRKSLLNSIEAYYRTLKDFEFQSALHEGAVSVAFQTLLSDTARPHGWTLIPQLSDKQGTRGIRPDGTFKDQMNLVRGHWEAKDTSDNLDVEIAKKAKKGYPLANIIFEDTRNAVLLQNKKEVMRVNLKDPEQLIRLIDQFFGYIEPQIEGFEKAVDEFKTRVPELAKALKEKVIDAHSGNKAFKEAFAGFFELCKTSLNPNIAKDAVDDMLVQHLLTERLIREIFDNPEFTRRNVIAAEIEKVIEALTSKSFNRDVFLKSLDRFYIAIENAARTITDWSDKQHFLNTIYERFFQGYSVKLADTMGIVYTPQPIVDFMCASVAEVLEKEFGKTLGSPDVNILDPCTGTGNFIVNLMKRIPKRDLPRVYKNQLFANEIMLLPYYIAAMNIEHAYYELTGEYEAFEGLCFVDTLDLAEASQTEMSFMTEKNTERVARQKGTPITVIIGNPPYNQSQQDENDRNRNRIYEVVEKRISETYIRDGTATLRMQLYDAYVKFLRWATDRLGSRPGVVCLVSNNGFLRGSSFDGLRRHLRRDFNLIYHFDFKGNARTAGERRRQEGGNIFNDQIRAGIGISILIRSAEVSASRIRYHAVGDYWRAARKAQYVASFASAERVPWALLTPDDREDWLTPQHAGEFGALVSLGTKEGKRSSTAPKSVIFEKYSSGVKTNCDSYVYSFSREALARRAEGMVEDFNAELDRWKRKGSPDGIDGFLNVDPRKHKWIRNTKRTLARGSHLVFVDDNLRIGAYRPFDRRYYFFHRAFNEDTYQFPRFLPTRQSETENVLILAPGPGNRKGFGAFAVRSVPSLDFAFEKIQCFPFYVYDEDGTNRRENITDWALEQFRTHYSDPAISKWSIFDYVYGILHHPGYRTKFADNLKRELPRIPFAPDFAAFQRAGQELIRLHLDYEKLEPWKLQWIETPGVPLSYRVEKMRLSKDKTTLTVNESLSLGAIPPEVFEYRLGNRSALDWVIDQYQVYEDKRSGIKSDPNREDDPEYIVRLIGQVVRVSVESVKIVKGLPAEFVASPIRQGTERQNHRVARTDLKGQN
jgi:predicted helicase